MTIPRKGARRIVVAGCCYHWRVRHKPTYYQGLGNVPLTFSVQQGAHGSVLIVDMPGARPDNWVAERPAPPVLPSTVAHAIHAARLAGWEPLHPGKPFLLSLPEAPAEDVRSD